METTYGFCFCPLLDRDDCSGHLILWVDCGGETCCTATPYDVGYGEWDPVMGELKLSECAPERHSQLAEYAECMERDILRVEGIIRELEAEGRCKADHIIRQFQMAEEVIRVC